MKLMYGGKTDLSPGSYLATCCGFEEKISKGGNPMVELTFDIQGCRVKDYFLDKTPKFKIDQLVSSLGLDITSDIPQELDLDGLFMIGKVLEVQIINEDFNGKLRSKIDSYLPMGTLPPSKDPF